MGAFERRTEEIHADWWDDDEVVVVKERTYAETQRMAMASMPSTMVSMRQAKDMLDSVQMDMSESSLNALLYSIESWTLKGPDGAVAPLTMDMIRRLSHRTGEFIMEGVSRLNPQRDDAFPGGRGDGVPERDGAAAERTDGSPADPGDGLDDR